MLRESVTLSGAEVDMAGLTDPSCTNIKGVPHSNALLRFVDTYMGADPAAYAEARVALSEAMGERAMIDAVGIASNFQFLDRIADATGIPSDPAIALMQEDLVKQFGLSAYQSASNTPKMSWLKRLRIKLVDVPRFRAMMRSSGGQ